VQINDSDFHNVNKVILTSWTWKGLT